MTSQPLKEIGSAGNLGDIPGLTNWVIAVRLELQSSIHAAQTSSANLRDWALKMLNHEGYINLHKADGQPFTSFKEFCEASRPWGLGCDADFLAPIVKAQLDADLIKS